MMKKFSWIFFMCLLNLAFVSAQEMKALDSADKFVARLKEVSKKTTSITADFTEEKSALYLKEPQKSSGVFYYKRSNKLRWEKTKPTKYIFVCNGDKVRIQENGKETNVSSAGQVVSRIKELMLTLVNGEFNSGKVFTPAYFQNKDAYFVKLVPKNKRLAKMYNYILLTFTKDTLLLKELSFFEASGDKSIMTFSNTKTNAEIPDKTFTDF